MNSFDIKKETNFPPAFFENPELYKEKSDYFEYESQKEERKIEFEKYYKDTPMSNIKYNNHGVKRSATRGIQDPDVYTTALFSVKNLKYIQLKIRQQVYKNSKYIIGDQDPTELLIILRSFHIQYSRNINNCTIDALKEEIKRVDDIVINFCVPRIISEIKQYFHYLKDASSMPVPIEHPKNLSGAGVKSLNPSLAIPFDRNFA